MPGDKYVKIYIGDMEVICDDPAQLPVSINYSLEDPENFTEKKSSNALALKIPAILINDRAGNTFHNPSYEDMTAGEQFGGNRRCIIESNGTELLSGKAFLVDAIHTNKPVSYEFDLYGDNADWIIDLQEKTFYDLLKNINFSFTKAEIVSSWAFDGRNEMKPYVFAPVRYRGTFDEFPENLVTRSLKMIKDFDMAIIYMKPSLSVYWVLYKGLKYAGYKIKSRFCDLDYFRRMVMPWTFGSFITSQGTLLNIHLFLAKSSGPSYVTHNYDGYIDMRVSNSSNYPAFDNNGDYAYNILQKRMEWTYKTNKNFGPLVAAFSIQIDFENKAGWNSNGELRLEWSRSDVNGNIFDQETHVITSINSPMLANNQEVGIKDDFYKVTVAAGESVFCKAWVHIFESTTGNASIKSEVLEFKLDYFKIPLGGTINFENYTGLKSHLFLDFLKGVVGLFNLSFNTDNANKIVTIEPTHRYSVNDDITDTKEGYFNEDFVIWDGKEDLSKEWKMTKFREYEKEVTFKFKDDGNDGVLKVVQDRHVNILGAGKYVFPDRFKKGLKNIENTYFSALMHYDVEQWKGITGIAPQLPVMAPENVSNTSASEAENTFIPKIAFYKGNVSGVGGWHFDGEPLFTLPFMFSVNYKDGGVNDPILSFSDEKIMAGSNFVIGRGLLKRFFWQRLAIMRNGQWYSTWFNLKNIDVANQLHREHKIYNGQKWELVNINNYMPLQDVSTSCLIRKWSPITKAEFQNSFPTQVSILNGIHINPLDLKYNELKGLSRDIPS